MTTTTDRAAEIERLKTEITGAFALAAMHNARGDFATGANFMRQVEDLRKELEGLS